MKQPKICTVIVTAVTPNASQSKIVSWENESLKIKLQSHPRDGKANKELISLLSHRTKVSKKNISIRRGHASRQKWIAFDGIDRTGLLNRLGIQEEPTHG